MLPTMTSSIRKPTRVLYATLAMLTLLLIASPGRASAPQTSQSSPGNTGDISSQDQPDATCPPDGQCFADVPSTNAFYTFVNRIFQQDLVTGYACGSPGEPCDPYSRPYYRPVNNVTRQQMAKFIDNARRLPEIHIDTATQTFPLYARTTVANNGTAVYGWADCLSCEGVYGTSASGTGVWGHGTSGDGVLGTSTSGFGVRAVSNFIAIRGTSTNSYGVQGWSTNSVGVGGVSDTSIGTRGQSSSDAGVYGISYGTTIDAIGVEGYTQNGYAGVQGDSSNGIGVVGRSTSDTGVYAVSTSSYGLFGQSSSGYAGYFSGNAHVSGTLSKGAGAFKIDHPLDPANQYLYHSFVESPDMMNIYNGNVTTDDNGEAMVTLPAYFEALNRDFRYQLTVIGQFAQAIVSEKVKENHFAIKTDKPNVEVSWQVTGIRQDPYANAHRIPVEEDKLAGEKGKYLHPTEWGQPVSLGVDYEKQQQMQQATQSKP
jgi:hypothetical protein